MFTNLHWSQVRVGDVLDLPTIPVRVTVLDKDGPNLVVGMAEGGKPWLHVASDNDSLWVTNR